MCCLPQLNPLVTFINNPLIDIVPNDSSQRKEKLNITTYQTYSGILVNTIRIINLMGSK